MTRLFLSRRRFLRAGCLVGAHLLAGCGGGSGDNGGGGVPLPPLPQSNIENLGPLQAADANGVRLPPGFTSRILARTGEMVAGTAYEWHGNPDGGGTFATPDGGWIYVSNSERGSGRGGVGALRFDRDAVVVDAYPVLQGTNRNCAGGATPWGTWLSCEEVDDGLVYECDPTGLAPAVAHPAMGRFEHEAAAVDPVHEHVYLTEDLSDGGFYRFAPDAYPDLSSGRLEVAGVAGGGAEGPVVWHEVPDPDGAPTPTRSQVSAMTEFRGGEGIDFHDGRIYFGTKGDNRVWCYDTVTGVIEIRYDGDSILRGVDNLVVGRGGDILVGEDGGDMQIVALTPAGSILPVIQLVGHDGSEVTGPAFDPGGTRLYFSSQRGTGGGGITFEVTGPFVA